MDHVFKALADPTRRKLLDALRARNGQTLGELVAKLRMSRQAASKHLALLERADLLVPVWAGREKRLYLNPVPLELVLRRWIDRFDVARVAALADLKEILEDSPHERAEVSVRRTHRRTG